MSLSIRVGKVRSFVNLRRAENDNYGGLQLGFTTYDTQDDGRETYSTSYCEWGGRSDHIYDALCSASGIDTDTRYVDESGCDVAYVGTLEQNSDSQPDIPQLKVA